MDYKSTMVTSEQFIKNILRLKMKLKSDLLSDVILYGCKNCGLDLPLNCEGVIQINHSIEKNIGVIIEEMTNKMILNHTDEKEACLKMVCIHPHGTPTNILVSFPETDPVFIQNFSVMNVIFTPKLLVTQENDPKKVICVLYQKEGFDERTYSEFIKCNFNTHLNCEGPISESLEDLIWDDESANYYQQKLPRISGGGRKLSADYNYECIWCPKEVVRLGKKGRFKEFRSYRDHFKAFHLGEDGDGVPMADFLARVHRIDPKWFCKVCGNHYSLRSVMYHKSVCKQPEEEYTESESENEDIEGIAGPSNQISSLGRPNKRGSSLKRKKACIYSDSSSEEKEPEETEPLTNETTHDIDTEIFDTRNEHSKTIQTDKNPKRIVLDESFDGGEANCEASKRNVEKNVKMINKDYTFLEVDDELYCSSPEIDLTNKPLEPKIEINDEPEIEIEVNLCPKLVSRESVFNKWWLKVPKHLYGDRSLGGPKIFLPNDSEEFVKRCTDRYKKHVQDRLDLDQKMKEAESEDAQILQFSTERDKPILEKYTAFVQTCSAKDVLNVFSEEREQLDLPTGAKSSTAGQYKNRIVEFFKFMSRKYHNYHLDWMVDFKGKIDKMYPDGNNTKDIFIPTKEDLTEFIKQFKYGGKPNICNQFILIDHLT